MRLEAGGVRERDDELGVEPLLGEAELEKFVDPPPLVLAVSIALSMRFTLTGSDCRQSDDLLLFVTDAL